MGQKGPKNVHKIFLWLDDLVVSWPPKETIQWLKTLNGKAPPLILQKAGGLLEVAADQSPQGLITPEFRRLHQRLMPSTFDAVPVERTNRNDDLRLHEVRNVLGTEGWRAFLK